MPDFSGYNLTNEAPVVISEPTPLTATRYWKYHAMAPKKLDRPVFVYKITHVATGRGYIGITQNPRNRWKDHVKTAFGPGCALPLHRALHKYGVEAFTFEVIYEAVDWNEACAVERGAVASHSTFFDSGGGFNLTTGGERGHEQSRESKRKLSATVSAWWADPANIEKQKAAIAKKPPITESHKEHLRRQAAAMKGKKRKRESVEKGRLKRIGQPGNWIGKTHSVETKEKMSAARAKYWETHTPKMKGKTLSQETKTKMSVSMSEAWSDAERKSERLAKSAAKKAQSDYSQAETMKRFYDINPEARIRAGELAKRNWADPEIRARILETRRLNAATKKLEKEG